MRLEERRKIFVLHKNCLLLADTITTWQVQHFINVECGPDRTPSHQNWFAFINTIFL